MEIEQWYSQPNDKTEHYEYWNGAQAWQPKTFSENTKKEKKWNDLVWAIIFYVQFGASIVLTIAAIVGAKNRFNSNNPSGARKAHSTDADTTYEILKMGAGIGFGIGIVINILHTLYALFAPRFYIKFGFWIPALICCVVCIPIAVKFKFWYILIIPVIVVLLVLCCYCCLRRYIPFSTAVFKKTVQLMIKYPSLIGFTLLELVIDIVINIIFSIQVIAVYLAEWSRYILIWSVLSFFWTNLTVYYVDFMTGAGLASSWYFLNDTDYFPQFPVWESFKRAMTTSFGSASEAGFLLAVIKTLNWIIENDSSDDIYMLIFKLIALCILCILECIVSFLNHYGLIYCATFGIKYTEGCRRWLELSTKRFCNVICEGCIIEYVVTWNWFCFALMSLGAGAGLGYWYGVSNDVSVVLPAVFWAIFGLLFAAIFFNIISAPLEVISDTLFVCFAENPERLKTTANDLYQTMAELYHDQLDYVISKKDKKKKKKK